MSVQKHLQIVNIDFNNHKMFFRGILSSIGILYLFYLYFPGHAFVLFLLGVGWLHGQLLHWSVAPLVTLLGTLLAGWFKWFVGWLVWLVGWLVVMVEVVGWLKWLIGWLVVVRRMIVLMLYGLWPESKD